MRVHQYAAVAGIPASSANAIVPRAHSDSRNATAWTTQAVTAYDTYCPTTT